jgi:hypothetical protein
VIDGFDDVLVALLLAAIAGAWLAIVGLAYRRFERRGRGAWQGVGEGLTELGTGPYRMSGLVARLERAPGRVRGAAAMCLGVGALWPVFSTASLMPGPTCCRLTSLTGLLVRGVDFAWVLEQLLFWVSGLELLLLTRGAVTRLKRVAMASLLANAVIAALSMQGGRTERVAVALALALHAGLVLLLVPRGWPSAAEHRAPRGGWPACAAGGLFYLVFGGVAVAMLPVCSHCSTNVTAISARQLRSAAEQWRAVHETGCPTPRQLVADKLIDPASKLTDSWSEPFHIECAGDETTVWSAGPDRIGGTDDDIRVPAVPSVSPPVDCCR